MKKVLFATLIFALVCGFIVSNGAGPVTAAEKGKYGGILRFNHRHVNPGNTQGPSTLLSEQSVILIKIGKGVIQIFTSFLEFFLGIFSCLTQLKRADIKLSFFLNQKNKLFKKKINST